MTVEKLGIVEEFIIQCNFIGQYKEPMICIRVPLELITQAKSIDFDICFDVTSREIEVVQMINSQTRENIGLASFQTGQTEIQILRRAGAPTCKPFWAAEIVNESAAM